MNINHYTDLVNKALEKENFITEPERLYLPIEYALSQGGKRIRPVFVLLSAEMFGGRVDDVMGIALGMEIFHNFTLLHDDIMDKSPLRRGMQTVYKKWDENTAILSGDTMFALAYKYILQNQKSYTPSILNLFTQMAIEICEGQQYDMDFETMDNVTIDNYLKMIRLKTAVFFANALKMGAVSANASEKDADLLYECGINLGLAFQLQDDFLDCYGNTAIFGKLTGTDIADNKKTFLYLKALELSSNEDKTKLKNYFSSTNFIAEEKEKAVKEIYELLNIKQLVFNEIVSYSQKALNYLNQTSIAVEKKTILSDFIKELTGRQI